MNVTRLVIEERNTGSPAREEALLASHAATLGVPVLGLTWKPFVRGQVRPEEGDVVAGSVAFVRGALQALGLRLPLPTPYPGELAPWLFRRVWSVPKLSEALAAYELSQHPVFIKPAKRWKLFTGFVLDTPVPPQLYAVSKSEPVWCSEAVNFVSEWRAYVVRGEVRFIGRCPNSGNVEGRPDEESIRAAARAYVSAPSAYAIDFGILKTGETALVEANDGFSVGAYDDVPAEVYWDMVATRWQELSRV